jgi:altronate dehydratase large subunit
VERAICAGDALAAYRCRDARPRHDTSASPETLSPSPRHVGGVIPTFTGYRRSNGRVGVRNHVAVLPTSVASSTVARGIAEAAGPWARATPHRMGTSQPAATREQTERTLVGVGRNPNVGGTLVVGLGCEEVQSDAVAAAVADRGLPVREVAIQDAGGTDACIEVGATAARELAAHADAATAGEGSLGGLTLGIVGDLAGSERFVALPGVTRSRTTVEARPAVEALVERHAGDPAGHPIVPVVKVSGDAATLAALPDDVDVDARRPSTLMPPERHVHT